MATTKSAESMRVCRKRRHRRRGEYKARVFPIVSTPPLHRCYFFFCRTKREREDWRIFPFFVGHYRWIFSLACCRRFGIYLYHMERKKVPPRANNGSRCGYSFCGHLRPVIIALNIFPAARHWERERAPFGCYEPVQLY